MYGPIANFFRKQNYFVRDVPSEYGDIIAYDSVNEVLAVVEAKVIDAREAIGQALSYHRYADHIYIAVPETAKHRIELLAPLGLGLLVVHSDNTVELLLAPTPNSPEDPWSRARLVSSTYPSHGPGNTNGLWSRRLDTQSSTNNVTGTAPSANKKNHGQMFVRHACLNGKLEYYLATTILGKAVPLRKISRREMFRFMDQGVPSDMDLKSAKTHAEDGQDNRDKSTLSHGSLYLRNTFSNGCERWQLVRRRNVAGRATSEALRDISPEEVSAITVNTTPDAFDPDTVGIAVVGAAIEIERPPPRKRTRERTAHDSSTVRWIGSVVVRRVASRGKEYWYLSRKLRVANKVKEVKLRKLSPEEATGLSQSGIPDDLDLNTVGTTVDSQPCDVLPPLNSADDPPTCPSLQVPVSPAPDQVPPTPTSILAELSARSQLIQTDSQLARAHPQSIEPTKCQKSDSALLKLVKTEIARICSWLNRPIPNARIRINKEATHGNIALFKPESLSGPTIAIDKNSHPTYKELRLAVDLALARWLQYVCLGVKTGAPLGENLFTEGWAQWLCEKVGKDFTENCWKPATERMFKGGIRSRGRRAYELIEQYGGGIEEIKKAALDEGFCYWWQCYLKAKKSRDQFPQQHLVIKPSDVMRKEYVQCGLDNDALKTELENGFIVVVNDSSDETDHTLLTARHVIRALYNRRRKTYDLATISTLKPEDVEVMGGRFISPTVEIENQDAKRSGDAEPKHSVENTLRRQIFDEVYAKTVLQMVFARTGSSPSGSVETCLRISEQAIEELEDRLAAEIKMHVEASEISNADILDNHRYTSIRQLERQVSALLCLRGLKIENVQFFEGGARFDALDADKRKVLVESKYCWDGRNIGATIIRNVSRHMKRIKLLNAIQECRGICVTNGLFASDLTPVPNLELVDGAELKSSLL
jgi:hypothetical protein